jgi:hypothetical protein
MILINLIEYNNNDQLQIYNNKLNSYSDSYK